MQVFIDLLHKSSQELPLSHNCYIFTGMSYSHVDLNWLYGPTLKTADTITAQGSKAVTQVKWYNGLIRSQVYIKAFDVVIHLFKAVFRLQSGNRKTSSRDSCLKVHICKRFCKQVTRKVLIPETRSD